MAEVQLDNLEGDVTLFKSALEGAQVTLSDALTPKLREFVQQGTVWMGELNDAFQQDGLEGVIIKVSEIAGEALTIIIDMIPELSDATMQLINGILSTLLDNKEQLYAAGEAILESFFSGMREMLPALGELVRTFAPLIVEAVLESRELIFELGLELLTAFIAGIADHAEELTTLIVDLATRMFDTILENVPIILEALAIIIPELLTALAAFTPKFIQTGIDLLLSLVDGLDEIIDGIVAVLPDVIVAIGMALLEATPQMAEAGYKLFTSILMNIGAITEALLKGLWELLKAIFDRAKALGTKFREIGDNWIAGLWEGIKATFTKIKDKVVGLFDGLVGGVKKFLGISSPSKVFKVIGQYVDEGLADGIAGFGKLPEGSMTQVVHRVVDSGAPLADLAGTYNLSGLAPDPSFNIANQLSGVVEMDGFQVGSIVLRNMDDAAAFAVRGV
jgi:phage-related protein